MLKKTRVSSFLLIFYLKKIKSMNPPRAYMCSPSQTFLPPPPNPISLGHPSPAGFLPEAGRLGAAWDEEVSAGI